MAKKKTENTELPAYSRVKRRDNYYLRARIYDADGKRIDIYGKDEQELTAKVLSAQREIEKTKSNMAKAVTARFVITVTPCIGLVI